VNRPVLLSAYKPLEAHITACEEWVKVNGKFNSLGGFDSIIGYDSLVYPVYPEFTPSLPYKINNSRIVFTQFTLFSEERSSKQTNDSHGLQSEEEKDKNTLNSSFSEKPGKQVNRCPPIAKEQGKHMVTGGLNSEVNEATDSETAKGKERRGKGKVG
jgi:hypothetical protein